MTQPSRSWTILISLIAFCAGTSQAWTGCYEDLPDDYLPFEMRVCEGRLEGASEFLEGFTLTMTVPGELLEDGPSIEAIFERIRREGAVGVLTYPDGKTNPIEYEIVRHRGVEDIYMKCALGFFPWEYMVVRDDALCFAVYWWYRPPATELDLAIVASAERLLSELAAWHQEDDRDCADDAEGGCWSLFCALKHASIETAGEYNHHNTPLQTARFVIDELVPDHGYTHTLMDYNNAPSTSHADILHVLQLVKQRIRSELSEGRDNRRE